MSQPGTEPATFSLYRKMFQSTELFGQSLTNYWNAFVKCKSECTCAPFSLPRILSMTLESELFLCFQMGSMSSERLRDLSKIVCVHHDILPPQCSWLPLVAGKCQQIRVQGHFHPGDLEPTKLGEACLHCEWKGIMCPLQGSFFVCLDTLNHIFSWSNQLATFSHEPTRKHLRSL